LLGKTKIDICITTAGYIICLHALSWPWSHGSWMHNY